MITYWGSEQVFRAWHHSPLYKASRKELKLVPKSAERHFFDFISPRFQHLEIA